jgi:hypothetical protein
MCDECKILREALAKIEAIVKHLGEDVHGEEYLAHILEIEDILGEVKKIMKGDK